MKSELGLKMGSLRVGKAGPGNPVTQERGGNMIRVVDFETTGLPPDADGSRWIDTYKCALRLWPDSPRHTNSVLRYFLEGCDPGEAGMPPHRALPDCRVTARILIRCLFEASLDPLETWSAEPPLLPRVPMGKHFGKPWSEVPTDYLEWATRQSFDAGIAHTVKTERKRRGK